MTKTTSAGGRALCAALLAISCLGANETAEAAQLSYTAQTRTVSASASGLGVNDSHSAAAPDFAAFGAAVSAQAASNTAQPSVGAAEQYSQLLPMEIQMSGNVSGKDNYNATGIGGGVGNSDLNVSFTLDSGTNYAFDLNGSGAPGNAGSYVISLTGPAGTVFNRNGFSISDHPTYAGALVAGSYTLNVHVSNGGTGTGTSGGANSYAALLSIPEPGTAALGGIATALIALRRTRRPG